MVFKFPLVDLGLEINIFKLGPVRIEHPIKTFSRSIGLNKELRGSRELKGPRFLLIVDLSLTRKSWVWASNMRGQIGSGVSKPEICSFKTSDCVSEKVFNLSLFLKKS